MQLIKDAIFSKKLKDTYKVNNNDFTRNRKQTFSGTLLFMMNRVTKTLSIEIDNFIRVLKHSQVTLSSSMFTKSAFVQYRKKIKPEVFKQLSDNLINEYYTDNEDSIKLWRSFRLLAVDGSILTLPNTKELQEEFGVAKNQTDSPVTQGRISVLYDVLNGFVIDGILSPLSQSEKELAISHLTYSKKGDLIIYDRGYPSFEMIYEHRKRNIDFLFRVQSNFNNQVKAFIDSDKQMQIVKIYPGKNTKLSDKEYSKDDSILVRFNKVILPGGTVEVLISSLLDIIKYKDKLFKDLYFKRWKVELYYDELKNKLQVGNFSGYSKQTIYQDFYSSIFVSNIQTLLVGEINEELKEERYQTKYQYKVNTNVSYGILKNRILELFLSDKPMNQITEEIKNLLKKHTIPIRPNRNYERNNGKYRKRTKPRVTKNQKDAI